MELRYGCGSYKLDEVKNSVNLDKGICVLMGSSGINDMHGV